GGRRTAAAATRGEEGEQQQDPPRQELRLRHDGLFARGRPDLVPKNVRDQPPIWRKRAQPRMTRAAARRTARERRSAAFRLQRGPDSRRWRTAARNASLRTNFGLPIPARISEANA